MEEEHKKTALRMIPYGLYVLTARAEDGDIAAATVNWVTQASFHPPLIVVCVKADSKSHAHLKSVGTFALNVLSREQRDLAYAFFKDTVWDEQSINGQPYRLGETGAPLLNNAPASLECRVVETVEHGDHSVFVAEVVQAHMNADIEGRPDDHTLRLSDLGKDIYYGG